MTVAPRSLQSDRLVSLDAYRGLTMLAMASGGLGLHRVAQHYPDSAVWRWIGYHSEHVEWVGCAAWDLIQPSFMFMVGVALACSCASRQAQGQSYRRMLGHALWRSALLVGLGVLLRSNGREQTHFTFEDVLSQIGLGYTFLFLLWGQSPRVLLAAALGVLAGYWCLFYFWPLPPADFDFASVGVGPDWPHLQGIAAHWDKNTNAAAAFDAWFLNLFPRPKPFVYNGGGYLTLSFIPSLATMNFGLMAGELLRGPRPRGEKFRALVVWGLVALAAGLALQAAGLCPIVKRIWTPSWAVYSAGWTVLVLAGFFGLVDVLGYRRWALPLVVVGMNSITMYVMEQLTHGWFERTLRTHLGSGIFELAGPEFEPLLARLWVLAAMWLVCYWLYRQRIFIRI